MDNFANTLRKLRTKRHIFTSQKKLAKISGYTQTYISFIETGKANPSNRCKRDLLHALGVYPSDELVSRENFDD